MSTSTIRRAIGAVKDQTSISIAKVAGNVAPDLEVLILKATTHDNEPADEKYVREILNLTSYSRGYVNACVVVISKRLSKTHDWIVALKALILVHRLLNDGLPTFGQEIMYASRKGTRVLNMSDFRDEAHSNSWDHSGFVRSYARYLDQKLEFMMYERKLNGGDDEKRYQDEYGEFRDDNGYGMQRQRSYGDLDGSRKARNEVTAVREMKPEKILERLDRLLWLLDRLLSCRATGFAKNSRMVIIALHLLVKESFKYYGDTCEVLNILLDQFLEMEYSVCVKVFDAYVNGAKMIDELSGFYNWCKDLGVVRSSEFPEVQKITDKLLGTLERVLREKANRPTSPNKSKGDASSRVKEDDASNMNDIKALPLPKNYSPSPVPMPQPMPQTHQVTEELVNLKDDGVSADEQGNKLALALFSGPAAPNPDGAWETFPTDGENKVTSAWQSPAAESGVTNWESTLVETASNLSKQTADLAGGFDSLLLNGMYDQGAVRQHVNNSQLSGGSASSVSLPGTGKSATPILALPAPDGTVQPIGHQDPFAASLSVPPPSYVQIVDIERKQQLLTQEQQLWQQYASDGMQGQMSLAKIAGTTGYYGAGLQPMMSYGMPQVAGLGQPGGYYHATF